MKISKKEMIDACNAIFELFDSKNIPKEVAASAMNHILNQLRKEGIVPVAVYTGEGK